MQFDLFELFTLISVIVLFLLLLTFFPFQMANIGIYIHNQLYPLVRPLMDHQYPMIYTP